MNVWQMLMRKEVRAVAFNVVVHVEPKAGLMIGGIGVV
jgi:hypothetical protein